MLILRWCSPLVRQAEGTCKQPSGNPPWFECWFHLEAEACIMIIFCSSARTAASGLQSSWTKTSGFTVS
uniref:Uncharacterized protein n=1 Tax=Anguilla anguilla TaxID=7936 RepID=A0A0E9WK33_ANGAN